MLLTIRFLDMPSAPLAISSQSRKKLKQFSFVGTNAETETDKENISSQPPLRDNQPDVPEAFSHSSQNEQVEPQNTCPQTPASKITLAALIGNTEDAFNCAHFDTTPEDHVSWQHGPRSSEPASSMHSTQRGKKRAMSSSPASCSQVEKLTHFSAQKEPLDLRNLERTLKTPQHDPATDLWARYSTAGLTKANGDNSALPIFALLMTSSPHTPNRTNCKDSGLQRSTSCGTEWPTSRKKRRKLDMVESHGQIRDIFESTKQDALLHKEPRHSRVELLVGRITNSMMRRQPTIVTGPSSSSPLPDRADVVMLPPASPSPKKRDQQEHSGPKSRFIDALDASDSSQSNQNLVVDDGSSSEFGDPDIDLNFLETIELTTTQTKMGDKITNGEVRNAPAEATVSGNVCKETDQLLHEKQPPSPARKKVAHMSQQESTRLSIPTLQESDDEFALDDDTAFATEMQDLAKRYDTQGSVPSVFATHPRVMQAQDFDSGIDSNMQRTSKNDGFENDFDDDDDDLWDEIRKKGFSPRRAAGVGSTSQVRVFY